MPPSAGGVEEGVHAPRVPAATKQAHPRKINGFILMKFKRISKYFPRMNNFKLFLSVSH
jgi:hypothetical protein